MISLSGMNPDLYAVLPPNKKEEYMKMFPEPTIDYDIVPSIRIDDRVPRGSYIIGNYGGGYITKMETEPLGAIAFIPECPGAGTTFCDNVNVHEEQRLIKKLRVNK